MGMGKPRLPRKPKEFALPQDIVNAKFRVPSLTDMPTELRHGAAAASGAGGPRGHSARAGGPASSVTLLPGGAPSSQIAALQSPGYATSGGAAHAARQSGGQVATGAHAGPHALGAGGLHSLFPSADVRAAQVESKWHVQYFRYIAGMPPGNPMALPGDLRQPFSSDMPSAVAPDGSPLQTPPASATHTASALAYGGPASQPASALAAQHGVAFAPSGVPSQPAGLPAPAAQAGAALEAGAGAPPDAGAARIIAAQGAAQQGAAEAHAPLDNPAQRFEALRNPVPEHLRALVQPKDWFGLREQLVDLWVNMDTHVRLSYSPLDELGQGAYGAVRSYACMPVWTVRTVRTGLSLEN